MNDHRGPELIAHRRWRHGSFLLAAVLLSACGADTPEVSVHAERLLDAPIIAEATDPSIGANIQGPSLIRVPDWVPVPLGRYYLYFADHKGAYIRLAFADDLTGPWEVYEPGSLQLEDSFFPTEPPPVPEGARQRLEQRYRDAGMDINNLPHDPMVDMTAPHVASPDVHVDQENKRIVMYYHGLESFGNQHSRVAVSKDGIYFQALVPPVGRSYLRVFRYGGQRYGLAMPGQFYRAKGDSLTEFEEGPLLFNPNMRHSAVLVRGDELFVFWTRVGDVPERILVSRIDLTRPWMEWTATEPVEVLRPERDWEGANEPLAPSQRSVAYGKVNQLRDPAIFEEDGRTFLLYAVAGESGIGLAELTFVDPSLELPR